MVSYQSYVHFHIFVVCQSQLQETFCGKRECHGTVLNRSGVTTSTKWISSELGLNRSEPFRRWNRSEPFHDTCKVVTADFHGTVLDRSVLTQTQLSLKGLSQQPHHHIIVSLALACC